MVELSLENLQIAVEMAVETKANYFGVIVINEMSNQEELIINTIENMVEGKLDYYKNAYSNDLKLKTQPKIRIAGFSFGDNAIDVINDLEY